MTKVINFFGGPGVGKSTSASGVFYTMKKMDISCEYVSEYAKDCVWEETDKLLENQIHVFSEQLRRQYRLINKVDFIITDSPLILSGIYYRFYTNKMPHPFFSEDHTKLAIEFFDRTFLQFDNINFIVKRKKKYNPVGRKQTEDEAIQIDNMVVAKLQAAGLKFYQIDYDKAVQEVLLHLNAA